MTPTFSYVQRLNHGDGCASPARGPETRRTSRITGSDDSGFTLVEVLVSFILFTVVSAAAITAIVKGISSSNTSQDRTTASDLASRDIQQVRSLPDRTQVAAITAPQPRTVGSNTFQLTRTIADLDINGQPISAPGSSVPSSSPCGSRHDLAGYTPVSLLVTTTVTWPGGTPGVSIATRLAC